MAALINSSPDYLADICFAIAPVASCAQIFAMGISDNKKAPEGAFFYAGMAIEFTTWRASSTSCSIALAAL